MKLISCYIENYGKLQAKEYKFDGGLTSFLRENGAGKTTLASFLKAMFYGLPSVRAGSDKFNDRQHFYPFDGGKFGGNVTFEAGGKVYRIERFFDKKSEKSDETAVYSGGKLTDELGEDIGKSVFGLDEQSFMRTVYIDWQTVESGASRDINSKLNREVFEDGADLERALKTLDTAKKNLKAGRGKGGLIDRKTEERGRIAEEIDRLKGIERNMGGLYDRRNLLESEVAGLEEKLREKDGERLVKEKWATLERYEDDVREKKLKMRAIEEKYLHGLPEYKEIYALEEKGKELTRANALYENTPEYVEVKGGRSKLSYVFAGLCAVLAVTGIALCILNILYAGIPLIIAGAVCGGVFGYLFTKRKISSVPNPERGQRQVEAERILREIYDAFDMYELPKPEDIAGATAKLRDDRRDLDAICADVKGLELKAEKFRTDNNLTQRPQVRETVEDGAELLFAKRRALANEDRQISDSENDLERLPDLENRYELLGEEIERLKRRHTAIGTAMEYLQKAEQNINDRYVAPIKDGFKKYADKICSALGDNITMSNDFAISYERAGQLTSYKHLSTAQCAIVNLCLRLSLIDNMYTVEKPFIILDDPFVCLDEQNMDGAVKLLKLLAQDMQIIYFTCHKSRV